MTDIQLPLHQSHQKGMNLEIRGFSGNKSASSHLNTNENNKLSSSSTLGSATKRSLKIIEKTSPSINHNFQVLTLNPNNELTSFTVFDSIKSHRLNSSTYNSNNINNQSENYIKNKDSLVLTNTNSSNNMTQSNQYTNSINYVNHNTLNSNINWNEESNSGWTGTGVMSDRSSVYSIDDGDFDKEASRRVNNQFREIESILYERSSAHSSSSINECNEWLEKFPHIRILGKQIMSSRSESETQSSLENLRSSLESSMKNITSGSMKLENETGNLETVPSFNNYKYFRRRENSDINNQNLNLYGTNLQIRSIDSKVKEQNKNADFSSFEEEIFEEEGLYEELFAYDNQEDEILLEQNKRLNFSKRRRHGLPPITPKAAMKDLVLHFLFDHMWSELIDWSSHTIKTYAKSISNDFENNSDITCKTPSLLENVASGDLNLSKIIFNKSKTDLLPSISPTYNSSSSLLVTETNSSLNIPSNSNSVTTKANIIQLKLFDQYLDSSKQQSLLGQNMLSRDNSTLYSQPKLNNGETGSLTYGDVVGDLITKDLLQIKQINRNGMPNNSSNNSNTKQLNPVQLGSQLRVGSGTRRQYQNNYYRKRYSSIEMSSSNMSSMNDKNIIIHGAGLVKPTHPSLLQLTDMEKANLQNNHNQATSNPLFPLSNITPGPFTNNNRSIFSANTNNTRNATNQVYNSLNEDNMQNNTNNVYENDADYHTNTDYHNFVQNQIIDENAIDEINLLSQNFNKSYYNNNHNHYNTHNAYNYFGHHNHQNNHSATYKSLPPIENSLTSKPIRISSANNTKTAKEKSERPMTSTSTRFDLNGATSVNRRSTTPMGIVNKGITSKKVNFQKPEDSIYANSSFLSTKAFNSLVNNNNNNNANLNQNTNQSLNLNSNNNINNPNNSGNPINTNNNSVNAQTQSQSYSNQPNRRNSFTRVFK